MRDLRTLAGDDRGVSAVEFALILPVMVAMLFGAVSAANLVRTSIKLWNAAQSMADLVAQQTTLQTSDMVDFCKGGQLALAPVSGTMTVAAASVTTFGVRHHGRRLAGHGLVFGRDDAGTRSRWRSRTSPTRRTA